MTVDAGIVAGAATVMTMSVTLRFRQQIYRAGDRAERRRDR